MSVFVKIPKKLEETLGEEGSKEFIDFMNIAFDDHKGDIIKEAELRFEAKLVKETSGLQAEIKDDTAGLRTELKGDISNLRAELKEDIAGLRTELKGDISNLRAELKEDIANVKTDLIKWFVGAAIAQIAIILSVLSFVIK